MNPYVTPSLAHLLQQAIDMRLCDVHTAIIGRVEKYDATTQTVDVSPQLPRAIKTESGELVAEHLPLLPDVPVLFPRTRHYFMSFPIEPGDFVQVLFNNHPIQAWQSGNEQPLSTSTHGLNGAVAIPGIYPQSTVLQTTHANHMVMGNIDGAKVHISDKEVLLGEENPADFVALAGKVLSELRAIVNTFNKHTHIASQGPILPSGMMSTPASVAATKVKAS